jgi:hypothetical protein
MPRGASTVKGDSEDMRYFKSHISALSVVVGDPDPTKGHIAPYTVDFVPYWEEAKGVEGKFKVGYLKTNEGSAIKKLESDPNVEAIDKETYAAATTEVFDDGNPPVQIAGLRAPY